MPNTLRCWVLTTWQHLEVLGVDDVAIPQSVNTMAKTPSELKTPQQGKKAKLSMKSERLRHLCDFCIILIQQRNSKSLKTKTMFFVYFS